MSSNILGIYLLLASVSMLCICIDGFCSDNTDCRNGGVCSSMNVCECTPTWTGPTCESPNPCGSSPCLHGGTCESNGRNYTCLCRTPHRGPNCEYLAAYSSCDQAPCVAGECIDLNGNVSCECTPFTTGAFCERTPNCTNRDPCRHGGVCVDGQTADDPASCNCNNDWEGEVCEVPLRCNTNTCRNGGTCSPPVSSGDPATCECTVGWGGWTCEDPMETCSTFGCDNGGTCNGGVCECTESYTGDFCETVFCGTDICYNGGTCTDDGSFFYCVCGVDFTGAFCEDVSPCTSDVCLNGGTCVEIPSSSTLAPTAATSSYYCECPSGFGGAECERRTPCTPNPCLNGGMCTVNNNGMPLCNCQNGFQGDFCNTSPPPSSGLSQQTISIIAGAATAGVVVIVLIIVIACCCCRRNGTDDTDRLTGLEMGPGNQRRRRSHDYIPSPGKSLMPAIPNLRISKMRDETKMEFPRNRLTLLNKLGSGSFADVYKAEAMGISPKEEITIVAVKRLKDTATENDKSDLSKEISLFMYLDPHPNIVNILGCCTDEDPWYILMEYLSNGNLQGYLRQVRTGDSMAEEYRYLKKQKDIPPNDLLNFGVQIARGMEYLASRQCIHRDLAARNILLGEGWVCKVSDFGLARDLEDGQTYEMKSQGRVPVRWMSPESLLHNSYTSQSDVWSFAILIWEIVTLGSHPYPGMTSKQVVKEISAGYRLPRPEHCSQDIYDLMKECWAYDPDERPTFSKVKARLENMLADAQGYLVMTDFNGDDYIYLEPDQHTGEHDNEVFTHL